MTLTGLAILSRTEEGSDKLIYIKEFKSNEEDNDADLDLDLFSSVLLDDEDPSTEDLGMGAGVTSNVNASAESKVSNDCSIRHQFLMQSALEKMNQDIQFENNLRISFNKPFRGIEYMWIGLICLIDEYRFYGYITNTNVKIIVSIRDDIFPEQEKTQTSRDDEIKKTLVSSDTACNIFDLLF